MNDMLGLSLHDVRGPLEDLNRKLDSKEGPKVLERFKAFLREELTGEDMIYIPLEWSPDLGDVSKERLQDYIDLYCRGNGPGWRLPTYSELKRALKKISPKGFSIMRYYWTSTPYEGKDGVFSILRTHDGCGGIGHSPDFDFYQGYKGPNLRLVREVKLPPQ